MGLFSFFSKRAPNPPVDLETLIYDIAEYRRDEDFPTLYAVMKDREVYVPIDASSLPSGLKPGQTITTDSSMSLRMRSVSAPNGLGTLAQCATRDDSPMLKAGYVGMSWTGFLEMALKVNPPLYGVLLQGQCSWVALDLERIRYVLQNVGAQ